jgi:hypothetical protein
LGIAFPSNQYIGLQPVFWTSIMLRKIAGPSSSNES